MEKKHFLKALVVDDESHARETVKSLLSSLCPEVEVAGEAKDVESSVAMIKQLSPDLLFMDVQLGSRTCFEVFEQLDEKKFNIIFITAYDHYAIPAIRMAAIDYLLKPIQASDLHNAVKRCLENSMEKFRTDRIDTFVQNHSAVQKRIMLPVAKGFEVVPLSQIMYCVADGNYTQFYLEDGKKIIVAKSLGEYETLLEPSGMIRIHLSHIVNVTYVKGYSGGRGGMIEMTDGKELQLSQRRKQEFLQKIGMY